MIMIITSKKYTSSDLTVKVYILCSKVLNSRSQSLRNSYYSFADWGSITLTHTGAMSSSPAIFCVALPCTRSSMRSSMYAWSFVESSCFATIRTIIGRHLSDHIALSTSWSAHRRSWNAACTSTFLTSTSHSDLSSSRTIVIVCFGLHLGFLTSPGFAGLRAFNEFGWIFIVYIKSILRFLYNSKTFISENLLVFSPGHIYCRISEKEGWIYVLLSVVHKKF